MEQGDGTEPPHSETPREASLADLIRQIVADAERLLLQEFALLRAETGENLGRAIGAILLLAIGIVVCFCGALGIMAAAILLLGRLMPLWAASALVGGAILALGAVLLVVGWRRMARATVVPRRALQSLRETGAWAREETT
jgi:predicted signal transduction protein with EAL and GGDEF domain